MCQVCLFLADFIANFNVFSSFGHLGRDIGTLEIVILNFEIQLTGVRGVKSKNYENNR